MTDALTLALALVLLVPACYQLTRPARAPHQRVVLRRRR